MTRIVHRPQNTIYADETKSRFFFLVVNGITKAVMVLESRDMWNITYKDGSVDRHAGTLDEYAYKHRGEIKIYTA